MLRKEERWRDGTTTPPQAPYGDASSFLHRRCTTRRVHSAALQRRAKGTGLFFSTPPLRHRGTFLTSNRFIAKCDEPYCSTFLFPTFYYPLPAPHRFALIFEDARSAKKRCTTPPFFDARPSVYCKAQRTVQRWDSLALRYTREADTAGHTTLVPSGTDPYRFTSSDAWLSMHVEWFV